MNALMPDAPYDALDHDDANFIAHSREYIEYLLIENQRLRDERGAVIADIESALPDTSAGCGEYVKGVVQGLRTAIFRIKNPIACAALTTIPETTEGDKL